MAWRAELAAADRLLLLYLAALAALAAAFHPQPLSWLAWIGALAAWIVGVARWRTRGRLGALIHDFSPVAGVIGAFSLSGPVIAAANPQRWDPTLAALDRQLFGELPAAWFGLLGRPDWLVDLSSLFYASFYLIPVAMGIALHRSGRRADFERLAFAVVTTFVLSYLGYLLTPAYGPRVPLALEAERLGGGALSAALRRFLHAVELNSLDAFPSGHTALALVFAALAWRLLPRWGPPVTVLAAGIVFSTVHLSLHYVIDLVAGALLASLVPWVLPLLRRLVGPGGPYTEERLDRGVERGRAAAQRPSSKARQPADDQPIRSKRPPR